MDFFKSAKKNKKLIQEEITALLRLLVECGKILKKKGADTPILLEILILNATLYYKPKKEKIKRG